MRIRYVDDLDPAEVGERRRVFEAIDAFWSEFATRGGQILGGRSPRDAVQWIISSMEKINPRLMWEVGGDPDGEKILAIAPEADRELTPLIEAMLARAPALPGWRFSVGRPALPREDIVEYVSGRTGADISSWKFAASPGEMNLVSVCGAATGWTGSRSTMTATYMAANALLGEQRVDRWVGNIDGVGRGLFSIFRRGKVPDASVVGPFELRDAIERAIGEIQSGLPSSPLLDILKEESTEYSLYECKVAEAEDYPHRTDLAIGNSPCMPPAGAMLTGRFASERFSRCGEMFCYLKLESPWNTQPVDRRAEIEDALNAALRPPRLGCVCGAGTGYRYWYIDLSLLDVERAIPVIRDVLRDEKVAKRSWMLFADSELADEWVRVYDDTPPPPK